MSDVAADPTLDRAGHSPAAPRPHLFLHIPKTAGTSFLGALRNAHGDAHVLRLEGDAHGMYAELDRAVHGGHPGISCVAGHLPMYLVAKAAGGDAASAFRVFTLLRHPIARVFSLFRFLHRADPAELARMGLAPGFSFDDFIAAPSVELYGQIHNGMTRVLCGMEQYWQPEHAEFWNSQPRWNVAQAAMTALAAMDFGVVEEMDASLVHLARRLGLPTLDVGTENSTNPAGIESDLGAIAAIVARNQMDIALYEAALALFRRRVAAGDGIGALAPADAALTLPANQKVALSRIPGRLGFYEVERAGFSWLRSDQPARIQLRSPVKRARLVLMGYALTPDYPISRIQLRLDGRMLGSKVTWREPHWFEIETDDLDFGSALATLAIDPPHFISVRQLVPETGDLRYLSIAIHSVVIRPS